MLQKLRKLCASLPETHETVTWGHPNFRVGKKIFAAFHEDGEGAPCIWTKVDPETRFALDGDERFSRARHGGDRWVGIRADLPLDWALVRELVTASYVQTAPRRLSKPLC